MKMDIGNFDNKKVVAGDLIVLDNGEARLIVNDGWKYGCIDLVDGKVTSSWYSSISDLLYGYGISKIIPKDSLVLKTE
jgi:hypothetical protein